MYGLRPQAAWPGLAWPGIRYVCMHVASRGGTSEQVRACLAFAWYTHSTTQHHTAPPHSTKQAPATSTSEHNTSTADGTPPKQRKGYRDGICQAGHHQAARSAVQVQAWCMQNV